MTPYWITFVSGSPVCIEAQTMELAEGLVRTLLPNRVIDKIDRLPYPANPRLGTQSDCPPFCYSPRECIGKGACPKSHACND